jgi:hemoglobin/transferrin/lactoferrin receptor protein
MRAPTASETLMTGVHPYSQYFNLRFLPNPFLVPEEQKGWEFGFNVMKDGLFAPKDKLRIKADYYKQDVQNYITACLGPSGYDPVAMVAYSTAYFCNNFGTTDLQGVEVEADYDVRYAFAHAAYTYTQSNLPQQENGLGAESYMPDHVFSITGGLRFLDEKLEVGMRGTFVSKTDLGSGTFNDAYQIADFFSTYTVREGLNLGLTVENLFDTAYTPALSTLPSGAPAGFDIGRGRTFILSTRAQF